MSHSPHGHRSILAGLALGALAGAAANALAREDEGVELLVSRAVDAVAYPVGQVFLRLLFLVVVPLVFASLAAGVARLGDVEKLGRLGARTLAFFLVTMSLSAVLGIFAMDVFRPGTGFDESARAGLVIGSGEAVAKVESAAAARSTDSLRGVVTEILDAFLPRNVLKAAVEMQMLPLVVFALVFGAALSLLEERRRTPLLDFFDAIVGTMERIVGFAMKLAPIAVFCLIFATIAQFGVELLGKLAFYVAIVLVCYLIQLFLLYPVLVVIFARMNPRVFLQRIAPVMVTAFATSSSSATLPTSLRVAQTELGIRGPVAGFVLPLGATMNMCGTALFEGAAVLFVAQVFQVDLSLADQALVVLLCVLSSVGAAGVPGGSLPLMMIVMDQVGVPPDGIGIILGVDRLLDMGRTVVNVSGDLACAAYIERVERERLA